MCELYSNLKRKQAPGYKVAIKHRGRYYSPATGGLIRLGKVKVITKIRNITSTTVWLDDYYSKLKHNIFYNKFMIGRTSIFINKQDAINLSITYNLVLLKCVITTDLMDGNMPHNGTVRKVIAGKYIKSFKEITYD